MAPTFRVHHPQGIATVELPDGDDVTVLDLQNKIHEVTGIVPPAQILKSGYPPRTLVLVPELPLSSLGLSPREKIVVSEDPHASHSPSVPSPRLSTTTSEPPSLPPLSTRPAVTPRSPPRPQPVSQPVPPSSGGPDYVDTDSGVLVHRVVPDDNSCLFSSVALVFDQDITHAQKFRKIVVDGIRDDPETYNEAILNAPPEKYIQAILKPSTWGGAIELGIIAKYYATEICSIDVETGRVDRFLPEGVDATNRCILIYSGIHYDAATLAPMIDAPDEWHQMVFSRGSDDILRAAEELARILRSKRAYTNTATFDLKCEQCGQGLKGEAEARKHAAATGHVKFGEY
ncbi:OTU-domain-containing protein [Fistulina hepatica ATCC 64428]|nr:OTU-domain-containing protein [Fistulina hepatica ATCC 64428]